jgi:nitrogen fixation/metabolism regulation signal transduction histidine kinase
MFYDFLFAALFLTFLVAFLVSLVLQRRVLKPIHVLNNQIDRIKEGSLLPLAEQRLDREFQPLFAEFNEMVGALQKQKRDLAELSSLKTMIKLSRQVAHEVKNPLTPIKLSAEQILFLIREKPQGFPEKIADAVRYIIEESDHLRQVALNFLDYSKLEELTLEDIDLAKLLEETLVAYRQLYRNLAFSYQGPAALAFKADRVKLKQLISNLLNNSVEACQDGEYREISVTLKADSENVVVDISDNGSGFDPENISDFMEKEVSTKIGGSGMGLMVARKIAKLHQGEIRIISRRGSGTTVSVIFKTGN